MGIFYDLKDSINYLKNKIAMDENEKHGIKMNECKLLPCPFCGSIPKREVVGDILSINCPICVSVGFHNHIRLGCLADDQWNTRYSLTTDTPDTGAV